jgi:hypothetical protein
MMVMVNKRNLTKIFLLTILHLVSSLKSNNFCVLNQKECKGLLCDEESIKCQEPFNNDCGFNICSSNNNKCIEYFYYYTKLTLTIPSLDALYAYKIFEKHKKFHSFNKQIPDCKNNKVFKFISNY